MGKVLHDDHAAVLGCRLEAEEIDGVAPLGGRIEEHQRFLELHHRRVFHYIMVGETHAVNHARMHQHGRQTFVGGFGYLLQQRVVERALRIVLTDENLCAHIVIKFPELVDAFGIDKFHENLA